MALLNQKIKFLQGEQTALNSLITNGGAQEGSFYLTNDTHRLYIGKTINGKVIPVAVNEGVTTVADIKALPTSGVNAGEFYYATTENILCVYNGSQFIQINTDKNTTLTDFTIVAEMITDTNGVKITHTITDSDNDEFIDYLTIKDSNNVNKINVTTEERVTDNGVKTDYIIDIKGDKYSLEENVTNNVATVSLISENTDDDTDIKIQAGSNVTITQTTQLKPGTENEYEEVPGSFTISSSYENTKIKFTSGEDITDENTGVKLEYDGFNDEGTGILKLTIKDTDEDTYTAQINLGKYYTEEEIDNKFKDLNGMKYIGTVGNTALPTSGVKSGYTYMVDKDNVEVNESITANTGDLLIATGNEGEDGYLTTIVWTHIPSGDDVHIDTTYNLKNLTHGKDLWNNNQEESAGSWQLEAGTAINLIDDPNGDDSFNELTIQVKHANIEHTENSSTPTDGGTGLTAITAVSGVTVNDQGHVTDVEYKTYGIKDTTYKLSGATVEVSSIGDDNNKKYTVTTTDTLTNTNLNESAGTSVTKVTSETLTLSAVNGDTTAYNMEITWGSF